MSASATPGSRFSSEASRSVMRRIIWARSIPSCSAFSIAPRAISAAETRRTGLRTCGLLSSGICEIAMLAGHAHLAGAAGVLQLAGPFVGGGLGLLAVARMVGEDALVFDRPAPVVACDGKDFALC